jgi:methylsterol monooxygenase
MSTWQVPFSPWQTMLPQLAFFFVFEDMFHYFCSLFVVRCSPALSDAALPISISAAHQLLHTPLLYKHIHKLHHKYSAPFGLAAEYAHPLEVMILGTGTIFGPLLYCWVKPDLHIVTVYIWITLRLFQAIDAHSGYGKSMSSCSALDDTKNESLTLHFSSRVKISPGRSSTSFHFGRAPSTMTSTTWRL